MQHVRVATYTVTKGTPEEVAKTAEGGMLATFKKHDGFIGYAVLKIDDKHVMSISVWQSHKDAEEATALADDWVKENIAELIRIDWNGVADAIFNANALGE